MHSTGTTMEDPLFFGTFASKQSGNLQFIIYPEYKYAKTKLNSVRCEEADNAKPSHFPVSLRFY